MFKNYNIYNIVENQDKKNTIKTIINENKFSIPTLNNIIEYLNEKNKNSELFKKILKENNHKYLKIIKNNKLENKEIKLNLLFNIINQIDELLIKIIII